MSEPIRTDDSLEHWHRRLCPVTDWLVLSGDLHHFRPRARVQMAEWCAAGITTVMDVRGEWNDREFVAEAAPEIRYWHLGTHDDGGRQDDSWFDAGVDIYRRGIDRPGARLLVHCHMGINRGPSMGYRLLLEAGEDPVLALETIRRARPIAAIAYAEDALDHFQRATDVSPVLRERQRVAVRRWITANGIDVASLIRRIRMEVA